MRKQVEVIENQGRNVRTIVPCLTASCEYEPGEFDALTFDLNEAEEYGFLTVNAGEVACEGGNIRVACPNHSVSVRGPVSREARIREHLHCDSRNEDKADSGRTLSLKKRVAHRRTRRMMNARMAAIVGGTAHEDAFDYTTPGHGCD